MGAWGPHAARVVWESGERLGVDACVGIGSRRTSPNKDVKKRLMVIDLEGSETGSFLIATRGMHQRIIRLVDVYPLYGIHFSSFFLSLGRAVEP